MSNNDNISTSPLFFDQCTWVNISNCYIIGARKDAISIIRSSFCIVENNIIDEINIRKGFDNSHQANSISIEGKYSTQYNTYTPANDNVIKGNIIYENQSHFSINLNITDIPTGPLNTNWICSGNRILNNRLYSGWCGIYLVRQQDFQINNNIIIESKGHNVNTGEIDETIEGHGINIQPKNGDDIQPFNANGLIYNNVIYKNLNIGLYSKSSYNLSIYNNIFMDNGVFGTTTNGIEAIHCSIYDMGSGHISLFSNNLYFVSQQYLSWRLNNNFYSISNWPQIEPTRIVGNPIFNADYSIPVSSPANNAGLNLIPPNYVDYYQYDIVGVQRSQNISPLWDIGAYEVNNSAQQFELTNAQLITPTTLELTFNKELDLQDSLNLRNFYIYGLRVKDARVISANKIELETEYHKLNKKYTIIVNNLLSHDGKNLLPQFRSLKYSLKQLPKTGNANIPAKFNLSRNYPNPFNPSTTIKCSIPIKGIYTLKVYNVLGQEIALLNNKELQEGEHTFYFNAKDKPSGVYIYQLMGENVNLSKKMLLLK